MIRAWPLYLAAVLSVGCYRSYDIVQEEAPIPLKPWNLTELNSPYDDRNAAAPPSLDQRGDILFSSAGPSKGEDLDLVAGTFHVSFGQWNAEYDLRAYLRPKSRVAEAISQAGSNERGPRILESEGRHAYLYVFASDRAGSYDLYSLHGPPVSHEDVDASRYERRHGVSPVLEEPAAIPGLDDPALYEAYLSPFGADRVLFATDRGNPGGALNVYQARLCTPGRLGDGVVELAPVAGLCSEANDSFPYANGSTLVFASDRAGGFGGYDLYRSYWDGSAWSAPENLGSAINTAHDERRPVFVKAPEFQNDLLIFSSDRPGGLGGFDLYAVGVPRDSSPGEAASGR